MFYIKLRFIAFIMINFIKILLPIIVLTHEFVLGNHTSISDKLPVHGSSWTYGTNWKLNFPFCAGKRQSPIKIVSKSAINAKLDLKLENYTQKIEVSFIENNGHTVQFGFKSDFKAAVWGSATDNKRYIFEQLHFHWGSVDHIGSEHIIDGVSHPMEIHFVHYLESYGSFDDSLDKEDGLLVLAALFSISRNNNGKFHQIVDLVNKVPNFMDQAMLTKKVTLRSFLPQKLKPFFRYNGSLTSPPCNEIVTWIVFKQAIPIGENQERKFRNCHSENRNAKGQLKKLVNNDRPIQPLNGRTVEISV